jgi:hypothetical protein
MTAGDADTKLAARQHVRVVGLRTVRASVEDDSDDRSQSDPVRARTFSTILADHFTPSRRAVGGLRIGAEKSGPFLLPTVQSRSAANCAAPNASLVGLGLCALSKLSFTKI